MGKKTLFIVGLAWACGRSVNGEAPGGTNTGGRDGPSAGLDGAGTGGLATGGAAELGGGGWGNVANGAGWGPTGELEQVPGDHDIVEAKCGGATLGKEYVVQPNLVCSHEYSLDGGTRVDPTYVVCSVASYCMHQSECTAQPFGRCEGTAVVGCHYPSEACSTDADCTSAPSGRCPTYTEMLRCESRDRCWPIQPRCFYPSDGAACETEADCDQRAGGECRRNVLYARCVYDDCAGDSDCAADEHCACSNDQRRCYPADCRSDADCAGGQSCQAVSGCFGLVGFYCTSPEDGCRTNDDCNGGRCEYDGASFQCNSADCPIDR